MLAILADSFKDRSSVGLMNELAMIKLLRRLDGIKEPLVLPLDRSPTAMNKPSVVT